MGGGGGFLLFLRNNVAYPSFYYFETKSMSESGGIINNEDKINFTNGYTYGIIF